ncbi:hypothetical protein HanIR_Chr12g0581441 [Helianthus annuus]|nr:hypothetical protein HanIR_Chr12g0581441 [Helianthus annuus]
MNQKPGDYRVAIVAQLAALGARLDSILVTMKNDVEAIKNQMILHTTFEPDDPDPKVIENHQKFERVDYRSQLPKDQEIEGDEDDFIPNVNSIKDDGPIQITLHHSTNGAEVLDPDNVRTHKW